MLRHDVVVHAKWRLEGWPHAAGQCCMDSTSAYLPAFSSVAMNTQTEVRLCRLSMAFSVRPRPIILFGFVFCLSGIGQTVIFLPCGFFFLLLSFFQRSEIGCLPYFHTWCGLSANLGCRSEMCCTRLAEIQDTKMMPKIAVSAPSRNFVGLYLRN